MTATDGAYRQWLSQAQIAEQRLTAEQHGLLQAAWAFRQRCGDDYFSNRLLSHFLLHCNSGLKVAQIARLVGISRPTASHQQGVSSKEAIQAAHHRMAGRPYGKLLPRYAGPIVEFILSHPQATRYDVLDFIHRTWDVHVSTVALHHFCKKYGLDRVARAAAQPGTDRGGSIRWSSARRARLGRHDPSGPARAAAASPFFSARTQYAGAFLLMPQALDWLATAQTCFADDFGCLRAGLLTSIFGSGGGPGTPLPSGRDGRCRFRPVVRGPPMSVAAHRRRLASPPALVRSRCLLPPHLSVALGPQPGRAGEFR